MAFIAGQSAALTGSAGLVSLWDIMKPFNQTRFQATSWLLGFIQGTYESIFLVGNEVANLDAQKEYAAQLENAAQEASYLDLPVTHAQMIEESSDLRAGKVTCREMANLADEIYKTLRREMSSKKLFRLSSDTQKYFDLKNGFGEAVAAAFANAEYDIAEAGTCLSLSRPTACVFHAMRVLEYGLCALMTDLGLPIERPSWNEMIEKIDSEIRRRRKQGRRSGSWREEEQFHSEAAAQFMHFKNAWRNYANHKDFKSTEDEAEAIYRHVRDFMVHLSKKLTEVPVP